MQDHSQQYPTGDALDLSWRGVLGWYLSPRLTTLITGPMFLISLVCGCVLFVDAVRKGLTVLDYYPFMVFCLPGFALFALHVLAIFQVTRKLPELWFRQSSMPARLITTGGLWVGVLAFGVAFSLLEGQFTSWVIGVTPVNSQEFKSEAGQFSIVSPVPFTETTQSTDTDVGRLESHVFSANFRGVAYSVWYMEFPEIAFDQKDVQTILDNATAEIPASMSGALLSQKSITLDGYPGREMLIASKTKTGREATTKVRYFAAKARLYAVQVSGEKDNLSTDQTDSFLESFRLLRR